MSQKIQIPESPKSRRTSRQIEQYIPGGVDSPFRSFEEVGGHTIFIKSAKGSRIFDIDGKEYIDFLGAWGPAILGHAPHVVVDACKRAVENGAVFGTPTEVELELAKLVCSAVPSVEKIRFVNSGTEAVMSAVRLARGYTGKDTIVMFEGCYHGHSDSVLASTGHCSSAGIPAGTRTTTVLAEFNNADSLKSCLEEHQGKTAAVLIEPVACSMGVIPPQPGFLQDVRKLCTEYGALLIFDEVLTGLRLAPGGAQEVYGVTADLTCFGKALGGGMPIGAYGGKTEMMDCLQPIGGVYQAGTFSGNPVTMSGGIAVMTQLTDSSIYATLEARAGQLFDGLRAAADELGLPLQLQRAGSLFAVMFAPSAIGNFKDSTTIDSRKFSQMFHILLDSGVYLPPSSVDAACVSAAHSKEDIEAAIAAFHSALRQVTT